MNTLNIIREENKELVKSVKEPIVTILLPAYNEAVIIKDSLSILRDYLRTVEEKYSWEILVINDGSNDQTGELAEEIAQKDPRIRVYHNKINQNLGGALRIGFQLAKGKYIVVLDMDLSFGPDHIEKLLEKIIETEAEIVIASPYMKGGKSTRVPFFRLLMSKTLNRLMRFTSGIKIYSFTGMARAYNREFLNTLNLKTTSYSINPEIIHKARILRARIVEIPAHLDWTYQLENGQGRSSGVRIYNGIIHGLMSSFIFRPYWLFMMVGLVLLVLSLYMITWIFLHIYNIYPTIPINQGFFDDRFTEAVAAVYQKRPHAFLIGGFTFVAAIQFLGLGFISLQKKRYFDELFHLNTNILRSSLKK